MKSQLLLVSAQAARLALSLAIAGLLGRGLAPAEFAFVSLVSSLYIVAVELLDMGTTAVATREIAAHPAREQETLVALLALRRLIAAVLSLGVLGLACSAYLSRVDERLALSLVAGGLFLLHLYAYQLVFQLRQRYGQVIALGLGGQLGFMIASAAAFRLRAGGAVIVLLIVIREAALVLGSGWLAARMLGKRMHAAWLQPGMRALWNGGWMIGVAGVSYKLAIYVGGFILYKLAAPEGFASFSAAQRLLAPLADMAWLFVSPLFAAMGVAAAHGAEAYRAQLQGYAKLMLGLSSLLAVGGYFLAPLALKFIYGEHYSTGPWSSVGSFRWLSIGYLFALVTPVFVVGETTLGHARALMRTGIAALALSIAGNLWTIPGYGATGAAMVLCACETFIFFILLTRALVRRDVRLDAGWAAYLIPAVALAAALARLTDSPRLQLALALAWTAGALFVLLQMPAQKACRASLAVSDRWQAATAPAAVSVREEFT